MVFNGNLCVIWEAFSAYLRFVKVISYSINIGKIYIIILNWALLKFIFPLHVVVTILLNIFSITRILKICARVYLIEIGLIKDMDFYFVWIMRYLLFCNLLEMYLRRNKVLCNAKMRVNINQQINQSWQVCSYAAGFSRLVVTTM